MKRSIGKVIGAILVFVVGFATNSAFGDEYTKFLLHADGQGSTFVDSHSPPYSITAVGDAQHSSTTSKWGSSVYFDGSGDWLSIPDSDDWDFGTGDFSVDFWIRFESIADKYLIGRFAHVTGCWALEYAPSTLYWYYGSGISYQFNWSPQTGIWYHVAITRASNTLRCFINGTQIGSPQTDNINYDLQSPLYIGNAHYLSQFSPLHGYLDEVRISKGIARWTSNFTPPASPYGEPTVTLTASPGTIDRNDPSPSASLIYTSTDAASLVIDQNVGTVQPNNGSVSVSPLGNTTYKITATSASGVTATATATVNVLNGYDYMGKLKVFDRIGVGTLNPQTALAVNGTITAKEIRVTMNGWSDYVFEEGYMLPSLEGVESFIQEHGHLPEIPSEKDVIQEGISVSDILTRQMRKIEELTLYLIALNKENQALKRQMEALRRVFNVKVDP